MECPNCKKELVERANKSNGSKFLGCADYKTCGFRGMPVPQGYSSKPVEKVASSPPVVQDRLVMSNVDAAIGGVFHDAVKCALCEWQVTSKEVVGDEERFSVESVGEYFDDLWKLLLEKRKKVLEEGFGKGVQ